MRRWALGLFAALLVAQGAGAADYLWRNVKVGGGGYMPGIVFSRAERGLAYLRSDMGGAYRWDGHSWLPLQDANPEPNYRGVESIAADPVDPNTVYIAVGTYRIGPSAIEISHDRGAHWMVVPVAFRMGGNEEGRGLGERLAVDPNDTAVLYFGSRYDGLQRSMDGGKTWAKVDSFPWPGLGVPPRHERPRAGISFVVFDPSSSAKGSPSTTIFAGLADPADHHLFRSDDAGKTWQAVDDGPAAGLLPAQAAIDGKGMLYITYADSMGPYGVTKGAVFKYDTHGKAWTDITPDKGAPKGGYMGLSLDRLYPDTLVVASIDRDTGDTIWRSSDAGAHWQDIRPLSRRDVSSTPFLLWGQKEASFGWWMTGLAIDPFDSNHAAYTTGATVYETKDLGDAARVAPVLWTPWVDGVEQTAVITLSSPSAGPHLISGFGDIGGFTHFDFDRSPPMFDHPTFINTDTIDYAPLSPNVVVRSGTHEAHAQGRTATLAYSTDYGRSWQPLFAPPPPGYVTPKEIPYNFSDPYTDAAIAVTADGRTFVVSTPPVPVLTRDHGKTWLKVKGLPADARPLPDRADPKRCYAVDFDSSVIYASHDGCLSFTRLETRGLPSDIRADRPTWREIAWPLTAAPGRAGDLWYLSQGRLFHSTDGGRSFAEVVSDLKVTAVAFGKAPPQQSYPALFAIGTKGDLDAIWRSDDKGASWIRLNDDQHQYGRAFRCIAADPRVFGRVYVGTDGRGVVYGEPTR